MKIPFENQKTFNFEILDENGFKNDRTSGHGFVDALKNNASTLLNGKDFICQAINDFLDATGRFTHPATGEFNLMDPIFNRRVLVTAQYKTPQKGVLQFEMPVVGDEVQRRDPNEPGNFFNASGDAEAKLEEKGK